MSTGWSAPKPADPGADHRGGGRPSTWLGARAPGGLGLPDAMPTRSQMYAPRGVWLDDERLVVADTGNHRILIWNDPERISSHSDADLVLGQPDFTTEGAQAGGRGPGNGLRLPTGVIVHEGRLIVADAWNHRVLIWDEVPGESDVAPDVILGQVDDVSVDENRNGTCGPLTMYWPFGVAVVHGWFWVADTGNRRVLGWRGLPGPLDEPDVVIGQPSAYERDENGGELGPNTFRWPHDIAGASDGMFIADAGNHRLLRWTPPPVANVHADQVFGQPDFVTAAEFAYTPSTPTSLRFPYAIDIDDGRMAVADTANNRVLVWDQTPAEPAPATRVLGQLDFTTSGENRWDAVTDDTFCWPYGLSLHGDRLAVADSGNNRAMIWTLS
ncbi:MAG: NHL repeat-containing protein [Acidimicrobiia bacterium]